MENIILRIAKIADNENVSIGALERLIGASKGVLSRAIGNNTDIQSKWVQIIADNYPSYSAEWILRGIEPMIKGEESEKNNKIVDEPVKIQHKVTDATSLGFILDRYEAIAGENSLLKSRIEELEKIIENMPKKATYKIPKNLSDVAAEPKP